MSCQDQIKIEEHVPFISTNTHASDSEALARGEATIVVAIANKLESYT